MIEPITMKTIVLYLVAGIVCIVLLSDFSRWAHKNSSKKLLDKLPLRPPESNGDLPSENTQQNKPQPPPENKKPVATKPSLLAYEGILLAAGFAKREYGYSSYRLEIQNTDLGVPHEIWGVDLKRALEASGATIGDKIRASLAGHVETSVSDDETEKVKKKIWDVVKIE